MIWGVAYLAVLGVLFVRVQTQPGVPARSLRPRPEEPLSFVMLHHRIFYALLLVTPVEALLLSGRAEWRLLGLVLFAAGVLLYRLGGMQLGDSLSPFVLPLQTGRLVSEGLYGWIRHPMYLGQALVAIGAPMTLGVRWAAWLAVPALAVLVIRMQREEAALQAQFPGYADYRSATRRWVPFLF